MTVAELLNALETELAQGRARHDSPVIIEGHASDDFLQLDVEDVKGEARCEDDEEPPGLYIGFKDVDLRVSRAPRRLRTRNTNKAARGGLSRSAYKKLGRG